MKRWSESLRLSKKWTSLLFLVVCACVKAREPQAGSETHFLSNCQSSCPAPYSCSCGVCTLACTSDSVCAAQSAQAACSAESEAESSCRAAPRVCDAACQADSECAALGADFACREGQCRTSAASVDACAGDPACVGSSPGEATLPQLRVTAPSAMTAFKQLALGLDHGCALRNDGRVYCWGSNVDGELGTSITIPASPIGTGEERAIAKGEVPGVSDGVTLYAGGSTTCLSHRSGASSCWGVEFTGQRGENGDYDSISRSSPQTIDTLPDIAELSLGGQFSCARLADGEVRCWGLNNRGQLGDGTREGRAGAESALRGSARVMRGARQIASGYYRSCGVGETGAVWCWGGEFGGAVLVPPPSEADAVSAVRVPLTEVVKVGVGVNHACALHSGGRVSCWGGNDEGQLGDGSNRRSETPVSVRGLTDAVDIALGGGRSCALKATGQVACWGVDAEAGLGAGRSSSTPGLVVELEDAYAIGGGTRATCALSRARGILCWGFFAADRRIDSGKPEPVIFDEE